MKSIQRMMLLMRELAGGEAVSVEDICRRFRVSRRTVFRDFHELEMAGVPTRRNAETGTYQLDGELLLPPMHFTLEEALAMMTVCRKAANDRMIPGYDAGIAAVQKLEASLPAHIRDHCREMLDGLSIHHPPMSDADGAFKALTELRHAKRNQRKVKITYESFNDNSVISVVLHPHEFMFKNRGWYVIGFSELHNEMRMFKLERIKDLTVQAELFDPDPTFRLNRYLRNAWSMIPGDQSYDVEIVFSRKVAGNVEEVLWHATQHTERLEDGRLKFSARVDGLGEIVWWVLGYGKEAIVVFPAELRNMVQEHAQSLLDFYRWKEPDEGVR